MSTPQLGMIFALLAIGVIFVASLIAYWLTCAGHPYGASVPLKLPRGLYASSLLLIGVSASLEWGLRRIRANDQPGLRTGLLLTLFFAVAFLAGQALNWNSVMRANPNLEEQALGLFSFYLLTGLHAAHVLAGLVPLGLVLYRASQRDYSSSRFEGVKLCAQYWHFLGVIWVILLAALLV